MRVAESQSPSRSDDGIGQQQATVADPDDYNQTRRLRQIHDARERFPEVVREEAERVVEDKRMEGITRDRYREIVSDALLDYLIEVEPVMRQAHASDKTDLEEDYWDGESVIDGGEDVTLKDIVDANARLEGDEGEEQPLTVGQARTAYRVANRFLSDIGFGIEFDDGLPRDEKFDSL